jgi:lipopolysaccharide export LptBFGC system permease protein LptF
MRRPGSMLRALARRVCSQSAMERLIVPAIADLQHEHDDAIRRGLVWRRRWVRIAGYLAVWKVIAASTASDSARAIPEWARADDRAVGRTVGYSLAAITAAVALLMWAPVSSLAPRLPADKVAWMVIYQFPQALVLAIPLGLTFGILSGLRGRVATTRVRRSVAALAIVCSVATFVLAAWTMPAANQAFRELMAGRRLGGRGFNEMTLGELARTPAQNIWIVSATANRLAFEFHYRLALAFGSLVLGLFAMAVTAAWRGAYRVGSVVLVGSLTCIAYYVLLYWARQYGYAADQQAKVAVAWIPNLAFLAIALLLFLRPLVTKTQDAPQ